MSEPAAMSMFALQDATPPEFIWVNYAEMDQATERAIEIYYAHELWEIPSAAFTMTPTPILRITDPMFRSDYLEVQNYHFGSRRLREAFGADSSVVRYRPVDTTPSVPEIQGLDYQAFDVLPFANPFDPARMAGEERDVRGPDGSIHREWIIDHAAPVRTLPHVFYRSDFVPPAPMFRATGTLSIYVTDEVAERVMRAGITGIVFLDDSGTSPTHIRELR